VAKDVIIPTEAMSAHAWMVIISMLIISLATVNYNYKKPDMQPFRVFQIG